MKHYALLPLALAAALGGCGASSASTEPSSATSPADDTSGGETTSEVRLRNTTPIPVPTPGVPREQLSTETQGIWDLVEETLEVAPPPPPSDGSVEAVDAWAQGPFRSWLAGRSDAVGRVRDVLPALEDKPSFERGVGAGLYGYLHEATFAEVRSAPIPSAIVQDAELLSIYDRAMYDALLPIARAAHEGYRFCEAAFQEEQLPEWEEWAAYCRVRAEDVEAYYGAPAPGDRSDDASE